jgi:6-phosphogluconate dehydrogenase
MSHGLIGLGAMGANLARNIQKNDKLHVYNRSQDKVNALVYECPNIKGHKTILEMISHMDTPRTVITMLPHGEPTQDMINILVRYMSPDDIIVDCSNENHKTSRMRGSICREHSVKYLGSGMSGGAMGALNGPALMVGGPRGAYDHNKDFFKSFCKNVTYMGSGYGDGHYTKMVHNGVEYGMLQGMADVYAYCNQDNDAMSKIMEHLADTDIDGYITNCGVEVLKKYDIHNIADIAEMNNTGLWCSQLGYEYRIPTPVMNSAVNTRITSKYIKAVETNETNNTGFDTGVAANALRFVFAASISEGYDLMKPLVIDKKLITNAWSHGTIIDCPLIRGNYEEVMDETVEQARAFVLQCTYSGIPCPSVQAALTQYDFTHQSKTSLNFLMAQRNFFGQHAIKEV